jgi:hypothetical protein
MARACSRAEAFVLVTLLAAAPMAAMQSGAPASTPSSPPAGLIVGKTVDGVTGAALGGAIVSISRAAPPPGAIRTEDPALAPVIPLSTRVISDHSGRFLFYGLAAGLYTVTASKPGYIDAAFGRRFPTDLGSQPLMLREGERRGDVSLGLWKRAAIGGTVVDEAGEPVIGIQVRLMRRTIVGGAVRFTHLGNQPITDDRGVYRQPDLAPGDYIAGVITTQTTVPDSLQAAYAAATKAGTQQDLQRQLDRSRGLLGISGLGGLASGQRVGSQMLQTPLGIGIGSSELSAPPIEDGKIFVYPTVYYPSTTSPLTAAIIRIGPGDERTTIDFQLRPVVTSRISGVLMGPGGPEVHTALDLIPASADVMQRDYDFATATTSTDGTGAFVFLGIPPGAYTIRALKIPPRPITTSTLTTVIQTGTSTISSGGGGVSARPPVPDEPTYWASMPVTVGERDITDLGLTLRTGARLSGHVEFDGTALKPATERLMQATVAVSDADARTRSSHQFTMGSGVFDATGNFKTYQLPAGRYVVRGPAFPNWAFKGAFLNGRDVSDTPLELDAEDIGNIVLTYSDRPTELIGTARNSKGPDDLATILVFPAQQNLWTNHGSTPRRFKTVRVGADGVFRVTSVPSGDYVVVGVHGYVPPEWQDPAFLRKLVPLGTHTTVADGEIRTVDVLTKEIK